MILKDVLFQLLSISKSIDKTNILSIFNFLGAYKSPNNMFDDTI